MAIYIYSIIVTVLFLFVIILMFHYRITYKEKSIIEQKHLEIIASQIKPHFIYNVLNTIWYLCEKDPARAQQAIDEFSEYLRGNLDALNLDDTVPFTWELNNIKNYLKLEKLRFGDELEVIYDIETTEFRVPALSVQPIVENAVKHGVCASEEGGKLVISTRENAKDYEIRVFNTGAMYDPHSRGGNKEIRSHVGIRNSRERVRLMCGGTLHIASTDDKGTTVTIKIPRKNRNKKHREKG